MSRRRAREAAMQALFQLDMNAASAQDEAAADAALQAAWQDGAEKAHASDRSSSDADFARALVMGTREKIAEVDGAIAELSKGWKLSRMPGIDRCILRMSVYELRFMPKARPGVVINEAVELAKRFGTEASGRFVNGILGAMAENK